MWQRFWKKKSQWNLAWTLLKAVYMEYIIVHLRLGYREHQVMHSGPIFLCIDVPFFAVLFAALRIFNLQAVFCSSINTRKNSKLMLQTQRTNRKKASRPALDRHCYVAKQILDSNAFLLFYHWSGLYGVRSRAG